jgi:cell wall-associated NlpC family hydrolase
VSATTLQTQIEAVIEGLCAELTARYGWTYLEVSARIEPEAQRIVLHGEVAVDRLAARVVEAVRAVAPEWSVDGDGVHPMRGGSWHALQRAVVLLAGCPGLAVPRRVATELRAQDGPVQRLGVGPGGVIVVRGRDGTVGWLEGLRVRKASERVEPEEAAEASLLGPEVDAPRLPLPHGDDPLALVRAAAPWLDVPYRLGGVTEQGVDCSGLVQRLVLDVVGVLVPRHSSDQLLVAPRHGAGPAPGDLSFVWSDREALCHVGIGTGGTVIHASLSRGRVVEDSLGDFLAHTRRVMHVPFAELLALGCRVAGQPSLVAAGFRLGLDATG